MNVDNSFELKKNVLKMMAPIWKKRILSKVYSTSLSAHPMNYRSLTSYRFKIYLKFLYLHLNMICLLKTTSKLSLRASLRRALFKRIALLWSLLLRPLCNLTNLCSKVPTVKMFVTTFVKKPSRWSKKEFLIKNLRKSAKNLEWKSKNLKVRS